VGEHRVGPPEREQRAYTPPFTPFARDFNCKLQKRNQHIAPAPFSALANCIEY
jgi:hypothetical protein